MTPSILDGVISVFLILGCSDSISNLGWRKIFAKTRFESEEILYVFLAFQTAELAEKIRHPLLADTQRFLSFAASKTYDLNASFGIFQVRPFLKAFNLPSFSRR